MSDAACGSLTSRTNFPEYIELVKNVTKGDFSLVHRCRKEVCGALWGSGNADISGIGMATGYVLQTVISFVIVSFFLWTNSRDASKWRYARRVLASLASKFYDNAVFFTFAVQLASIAALTKVNMGVSAEGMGVLTMKITWAISNLTLLPLLPMALGTSLYDKDMELQRGMPTSFWHPRKHTAPAATQRHPSLASERVSDDKTMVGAENRQRFGLLVVCWCLSVWPFVSRMIANYGKSQIGDSPEAVITDIDWSKIEEACFAGVVATSPSEDSAMNIWGVVSWLFFSVILVYKIIALGIKSRHEQQWKWICDHNLALDVETVPGCQLWTLIWISTLVLSVGQLWSFFRLQRLQRDMTRAAGSSYTDEQFTFGQIVSVIVFVPVLVEGLYLWRNRRLYHRGVD
ncbi:hypothetical protein BDV95DRAFT_605923 [Massariosphaeria phaeospora]|uniref:Uncharacterized protein n=1 Tax=Massariosphaeria phaeospora TaxID=100035 RepID=A0A7C8I703_9PLEO|nr:hypothetical protein BDV95DRAFT_605923 [Massariosphaeria phaeospora]